MGALVFEEYAYVTRGEASAEEARAQARAESDPSIAQLYKDSAKRDQERADEYRPLSAYGVGSGLTCVLSIAAGAGTRIWFSRRKREQA